LPSLALGTTAQSPRAHTVRWPRTRMSGSVNWFAGRAGLVDSSAWELRDRGGIRPLARPGAAGGRHAISSQALPGGRNGGVPNQHLCQQPKEPRAKVHRATANRPAISHAAQEVRLVAEYRGTTHGFDLHFGWPECRKKGFSRGRCEVILTKPLAEYFKRFRMRPWELAIGAADPTVHMRSAFGSKRMLTYLIESPSLCVSFQVASSLNATTQTAFAIGGDEPWPDISALPSPR
jgi:hypothetical protein